MTAPKLTGNRCQCPTCGDYFASVRGFSRHRIGTVGTADRRCLTSEELGELGWRRNDRGFLLTPDPRRAGTRAEGPSVTPPATLAAVA
jgi:hypothetical protein